MRMRSGFGHTALAAFALLAASSVARAGAPVVIDAFDDTTGWRAQPADGVGLSLHSDAGASGRSMRLDFRFVKGGGYAVVHKAVSLELPADYRFRFLVRGRCPTENLEFKLVDASGENVWWSNQRDFRFAPDWTPVSLRKRRIGFAWGPVGGGEIRHVAAIEFAVTAGSGGEGSVWLDELTLEAVPADDATPPKPAASATSAGGAGAAAAVDGNPRTAWVSAAGDRAPVLTVDYGVPREFGGLTLAWTRDRAPGRYRVETSEDGARWTPARVVDRGAGMRERDRLFLPESEARHLRVMAIGDVPEAGVSLAELILEPPAFGASLNDLYAAVAKDARRGLYPRGISGEQSFWTVVGLDGAREEGLLSEDGALEVGKGRFSVEPFLWLDGKLVTWADVTMSHALVDGDLPLPSVTWHAKGLDLEIAVAPRGRPGDPRLIARYRLAATGRSRRAGVLYLALRPFQVDPPSQFLNTAGGAATVDSIVLDGTTARVGPDAIVDSGTRADGAGAVTFDEGDVVESWLARGVLPPRPAANDPFGHASGVYAFKFDVEPGTPAEFRLDAAPKPGPTSGFPAPLASPAEVRARTTTDFAAARDEWRAKADKVRIALPDSARDVLQTLKAQIGWILVNKDSAGIQPGSRSYDRSWIRDGALTCSALLRLGHADDVKAYIEWFAPYQYADGKVPCCVDRRGSDPVPEHDSHGEFIYLLAQYLRYTRDQALAVRMWQHVAAAAAYLDTLRAQRSTGEWRAAGKEAFYGILPPSISHEGYSAKPMHSYWDDLWALRGYKDAAYLAGATGHPEARERLLASGASFARDLAASVRASMRTHAIPFVPGCADLGDFDATSTTIAFDPVQADTVLPAAAVDSTFERYWGFFRDRRDGRRDWDAFTPYEMRTIGAFVRLGWRDRADSLLSWFMTQRKPVEWRQWPEVVWKDERKPHFIGDLPHTWVGSDFARSVLDMLAYARERDDALVIAAGVPLAWARGTGVTVHDLPTSYGRLGYALHAREGRVEVDLERGLRMPAGGIVVAPPGERRFTRASIDDAPARLDADGRVTVWKLPASVSFEY